MNDFFSQTLVWKTFAKLQDKNIEDFPVVIENVQFLRATIMPKDGNYTFIKFVNSNFLINNKID